MIEQCTASAIAQHNQKSEWLALERAKAGSDAENARQNELASAANRKAWNFLTSQHRSDRQIFENLVTRSRVEKVIKANNKTRRSANILPSSKRCDYIFYYPTFSSTIFFAWLLFCYSYKCVAYIFLLRKVSFALETTTILLGLWLWVKKGAWILI